MSDAPSSHCLCRGRETMSLSCFKTSVDAYSNTAVDLLGGFRQKEGCWQEEHPASSPLAFSTLQRTGPITQMSAEVSCPFEIWWNSTASGASGFSCFLMLLSISTYGLFLCQSLCQNTELNSSKESVLIIRIYLYLYFSFWNTLLMGNREGFPPRAPGYLYATASFSPVLSPSFFYRVEDSPFSWNWMSSLTELFRILASSKSSLPRNFFWTMALLSFNGVLVNFIFSKFFTGI